MYPTWDGSTLATSEKEGYHPMEQGLVKPESLVGIERWSGEKPGTDI